MVGILEGKGKEGKQGSVPGLYPHRKWNGAFTYGCVSGNGFSVTLSGFSPSSRM